MADNSKIEWTDATWNPVRGCSRVSAGCEHCYAERIAARFDGPGKPFEGLIHKTTQGWNGKIKLVPEVLGQPWRWTRGRHIFVNSMSDLFHENVPFEYIAAVFFVMSVTTRHTYQILTKRPARMLEFFRWVADGEGVWEDDRIGDIALANADIKALGWEPVTAKRGGYDNCGPGWPYVNVWIGVSVESQAAADERIPLLLQCPAAVRFLSCEPLLGRIDLCEHLGMWWNQTMGCFESIGPQFNRHRDGRPNIGWVIAGGESGPGARPMRPDWARSLRDQCAAAGVPFLFKQWGECGPPQTEEQRRAIRDGKGWFGALVSSGGFEDRGNAVLRIGKKAAGRLLDGVEHNAFPESRT